MTASAEATRLRIVEVDLFEHPALAILTVSIGIAETCADSRVS